MIDLNESYYVPLSLEDRPENEEEYVKCTVKKVRDHIVVSAIHQGYREKCFYPEYFEFLQYIKYIR